MNTDGTNTSISLMTISEHGLALSFSLRGKTCTDNMPDVLLFIDIVKENYMFKKVIHEMRLPIFNDEIFGLNVCKFAEN